MIHTFCFSESNGDLNSLNFKTYNFKINNNFFLILFKKAGWYKFNGKCNLTDTGQIILANINGKNLIQEIGGEGQIVVFDQNTLVEALMINSSQLNKNIQLNDSSLLLIPILNFQLNKFHSFFISIAEQFKLTMLINSLNEEITRTQQFSNSAISIILKLIIIDIVRLSAKSSISKFTYSDPLLNKVFKFIQSHYHEAISLSDVAKNVHKSTSYLTNFVKQKTGKTVLQWIIELRMAKARSLLLETNWSVEKIAETVGYIDIRHFSRQFRRIHGSSPKQWKLSNLQDFTSNDSLIVQHQYTLN